MTDGIKRDPLAKRREDRWQSTESGNYAGVTAATNNDHYTTPVRILPWPTAADGDGVTEPPTMDEVWPGRRMMYLRAFPITLTGAPPVWCAQTGEWSVAFRSTRGDVWHFGWLKLTPITPTTRLTVETTDPEALRRLLGNEHKIVEGE